MVWLLRHIFESSFFFFSFLLSLETVAHTAAASCGWLPLLFRSWSQHFARPRTGTRVCSWRSFPLVQSAAEREWIFFFPEFVLLGLFYVALKTFAAVKTTESLVRSIYLCARF